MSGMLRLELLGVPAVVRWVRGVGEEDAARLRRAWSRCAAPADAPRSADPVSLDAADPADTGRSAVRAVIAVGLASPLAVEGETFAEFASELTSSLTVAAIEARAGGLMMLHASGLADPDSGRTVAFVARSGMGKTTATRVLATRLGYVSDETVALDRSGRILPYPKPLSVIDDTPPAPKTQRGPDELGLVPAPAQATLAGVVLLEREQGLESAVLEPVGHADAMVDLTPQTSALARIDRPLVWLARILDSCGGALRVRYTEAHQLADVIPSVLGRPPLERAWRDVHEFPQPASGRPGAAGAHDAAPSPGCVRRRGVVDAVETDGPDGPEVLVLSGTTLVRLGGIAPAVWDALAATTGTPGIPRAELERRLERAVGLPQGYGPLLDAALAELGARGVVETGS